MPSLEAFAGLRYDRHRVRMDDVIAPPYDVIGPSERQRLASRQRANAVLVELPEADLIGHRDRYKVADELLADWRASGLLALDSRPALYPYRMTSPDGHRSTGIIGALRLPGPDDDDVLPHELTLPKPRSDRLDLLRATATNLSPIWGLSMASGLTATIDLGAEPVADAHDDDGVRHQLWMLDDPDAIARVAQAVASAPVIIADGHHRYETARTYQRERGAATDGAPGPYDLVMALIVELSEHEVRVGAIHRTVSGPGHLDLPAAFGEWFDVIRAGAANERTVGALMEAGSMALVTPEQAYLLQPLAEAFDEAGSDLDASLVQLVFDRLEGGYETTHRHTWQEATQAVVDGSANAAVLLRPVTIAQIAEWATARRRMPPKTTYFVPKPRTGMVFRPLDP